MTPMHAEHCQDDSVHGNQGPVQVTRITLPHTRDLVMGTLLAISILGNVFLYAYAKDAKTIAMLAAYDLKQFQTKDLPDLQAKISTAEELTKAYGLKESVDGYHHNQPVPGEKAARGH